MLEEVERIVHSANSSEEKKWLREVFLRIHGIDIKIEENRGKEADLVRSVVSKYIGVYAPSTVDPEWIYDNIINKGVEATLTEVKKLNYNYLHSLIPPGKKIINNRLPTTLEAVEDNSPAFLHLIPSSNGQYYLLSDIDIKDGYNPYTNTKVDVIPKNTDINKSCLLVDLWSEVICRPLKEEQ